MLRNKFICHGIRMIRCAARSMDSVANRLDVMLPAAPFSAISHPDLPIVIANSIPKSGTNLLGKLLGLMGLEALPVFLLHDNYLDFRLKGDWDQWEPLKHAGLSDIQNPGRIFEKTEYSIRRLLSGQSCVAHLPFRNSVQEILKINKIRHLFIVRDLRDCVVSYVEYIMNLKGHAHNPGGYYYMNALETTEARLMAGLLGKDRFIMPFSSHVDEAIVWLTDPSVFVIHYEALVGEGQAQQREINRICAHLGLSLEDKQIRSIAGQLRGGTITMNKGIAGRWRQEFTPHVTDIFNSKYASYMKTLGYLLES